MTHVENLLGKRLSDLAQFEGATLEQIGDRSYLNVIESGLSFVIDDNQVIAAHLYGGEKEGFKRFPFRIPLGVTFDMSRDSLRSHLGDPEESRDAKQRLILGMGPAWDRFIGNSIKLRAEYSQDLNSVKMFTVMQL
ncbi:hypothetical protein [Novosphingobium humi]|uniref:Uncharacterized protein n=1 Tax=Novosphingobium humi TaxID=2282397 RepID=A0ABY7TUI1_9SPHN|nr:hypothetical protein [Novosphingobium humi]WCT76287.1 hypothetical protein PQ457_10025 [Novosphingobium humi]